ncbi:MAG: hypothetical protein ACXACU_16310, partial [Candidatus Hodarchaeales archaeon]
YTKICETVSPAQILAIGNKAEKPKDNVPKKMTFWVKEHKLKIFPVSAKDNIGISLLLQTIMQEIENIPMVDSSEPIDVRVSPPTSE